MRRIFCKTTFLLGAMSALSACASLTFYPTGSGVGPATRLNGSALQITTPRRGQPTARVAPFTGKSLQISGGFQIGDGTYLLVDASGFDRSGALSGPGATGRRIDGLGSGLFSHTYAYVIPIEMTYPVAGNTVTSLGTIGNRTATADVPLYGSAQYTGEAYTRVISSNGTTDFALSGGMSIVDVNFSAASANVTLGLYTKANGRYGSTTAAPIDAVKGTGMQILGASLVGGLWGTFKNGTLVDVTGPNTHTAAAGDFYGYDPVISAPDQVGGVILMNGNSGMVYSVFVAD